MEVSKKEYLISILFPKHCPFCGHPMEIHRTYCEECEQELPWVPADTLCPTCGKKNCICSNDPFLKQMCIRDRLFPTFVDESAQCQDTIMVSAGKIGTQVELAPVDLIDFIGAKLAPLAKKQ